MKTHRAIFPLFTLTVLGACAQAEAGPEYDYAADRASIEGIRAAEQAAAESGDVEGFLALASSDMKVMQPNGPIVSGEAEVRAWLEGFMEAFEISFESYTTEDVTVEGNLAIEHISAVWTLTPRAGGDPVTERIKGIHLYRRGADGSWRMTHDIWNSNDPLPEM